MRQAGKIQGKHNSYTIMKGDGEKPYSLYKVWTALNGSGHAVKHKYNVGKYGTMSACLTAVAMLEEYWEGQHE